MHGIMYAGDTIAAIATPLGPGGIGIVRVSGALASAIDSAVFRAPEARRVVQSHHLYYGRFVDAAGATLDTGLAVLMRAPRSYTGEDTLELHCHGSPVVLRAVLARVLACGARLAEPGEFTKRAFLNGRLDLAQAEAVLDMIRARTPAGAAVAAQQLTGRLSTSLAALRTQLVEIKALLEAQIDFGDEDLGVDSAELLAALVGCEEAIHNLLSTCKHGILLREGIRVAIVGKPNVGKSSLLNALLGHERAIVTDTPGTTRDVIDETADFDGIPVVLSDTAGLRDAPDADAVERIGMARTASTMDAADVILAVFDLSAPLDRQDDVIVAASAKPRVVVLNKTDRLPAIPPQTIAALASGTPAVAVSATQRLGLAALRRTVVALALRAVIDHPNGPVLTNVRHVDALEKAAASLELARQSLRERRPADLVAVDVQDAADYIATITGAITSEDVLDRIFSEFCIGK